MNEHWNDPEIIDLAKHGNVINDLIRRSIRLGGDHEMVLSLSTDEIETVREIDSDLAMALLKYRADVTMLRGAFRAAQNRLTKRANAAIAERTKS